MYGYGGLPEQSKDPKLHTTPNTRIRRGLFPHDPKATPSLCLLPYPEVGRSKEGALPRYMTEAPVEACRGRA